MAKKYVQAGQLRKLLTHCEDSDEICVEFDWCNIWHDIMRYMSAYRKAFPQLEEQSVSQVYNYIPSFECKLENAHVEASAYSSRSKPGYTGTLYLEIEISDKAKKKLRDLEAELIDMVNKNEQVKDADYIQHFDPA